MVEPCPTITRAQLLGQCRAIGLRPGTSVMVHAGMRRVGAILGGPDVLIESMREAVGDDGTIMMYLGCPSPFDDVGRSGLYSEAEEAFILDHCPAFDPRHARANRSHGILAEFFRTTPGVICSDNPGCRMAACGAQANFLLDGHPLNFGLGTGSPLEKLCQIGGKILLAGSDLDAVTMLHYAEAVAPLSDKTIVRIKVPLLLKGKRTWLDVEEWDSSDGVRHWPDQRFFETLVNGYIEKFQIPQMPIGSGPSYLLDARQLVDFAVPVMVKVVQQMDAAPRSK